MLKQKGLLIFLMVSCLVFASCSKQEKVPEGVLHSEEIVSEKGSGEVTETSSSNASAGIQESVSSCRIENLFGFSAICEEKEEFPSWYIRTYVISTNDNDWIAAQTFGLPGSDYFTDIDSDGKNELISNCMWGGDGHEEAYVFRYNGEYVEIGFVDWVNLEMHGLNYWGVNAVQTYYDRGKNVIFLKYADGDVLVEIPIGMDSLEFSKWIPGADMPFIDTDTAFKKFGQLEIWRLGSN